VGDLKFSQIIWNCLKCLRGFSPDNPLNFGKVATTFWLKVVRVYIW